jgi:hypothetical protein
MVPKECERGGLICLIEVLASGIPVTAIRSLLLWPASRETPLDYLRYSNSESANAFYVQISNQSENAFWPKRRRFFPLVQGVNLLGNIGWIPPLKNSRFPSRENDNTPGISLLLCFERDFPEGVVVTLVQGVLWVGDI